LVSERHNSGLSRANVPEPPPGNPGRGSLIGPVVTTFGVYPG
jgi:hypothetical protein